MFDSVYFLLKHKAKLGELCDALAVSRLTTSNLQYLEEYEKLMEKVGGDLHVTFKRLFKIKPMTPSYGPLKTIQLSFETFSPKPPWFRDIQLHHLK